ncbi:inverse autotransporter beta domain-containing protein [Yersinia enterocolitica]|nr:hypothetical protein [Yersinia enterocolitica]
MKIFQHQDRIQHPDNAPGVTSFKKIVWANIAIQAIFPLSVSFAPAMAAMTAPTQAPVKLTSATKTVAYRLKRGESAYTVATRYGLSFSALAQLNQNRTFAKGFRAVGEGDEIVVPTQALTDAENTAQTLAGVASQTGSFLSQHPDSDAATSLALGMATNKANEEVQTWLNKFGTARVQLNVDKNFSLKSSQLALLHPWYDTPSNMVFTQTGIHRTDDRTQTNLGVGVRHFRDHDMLGANTFLDYDLSRDHARAGLGAEYWRDNLKLSANAYIGLTGWKNSPDVEDYDERPANGWDVRAEGYLPSYPQLGARMMYEQYYGDEVALFGKENRQKNPRALTAGVSYTPFPLLTLGADERFGQNGQHDTQFKAELNYRIGESLAKQLDTGTVAAQRSLAGSRYDLIDRNNNIILEYRKQEVIHLSLPTRVEGRTQQVIPVTLNVQTKYGLKDIVWDDADLVMAGGKLSGQGTQWQLTLPTWKVGEANAWLVSAVAHDTKGHASERAEMQVVMTEPQVSAGKSTLIATDTRLLADGKAQTIVTVTLKDADGHPVIGMTDQIALTGTLTADSNLVHGGTLKQNAAVAQTGPTLSALKETGQGVYTATLTAGTQAGQYALDAQVAGAPLAKATVLLEDTAADFSLAETALVTDKTTLVANGTDQATLTLTLMSKAADGSLHPVSGEKDRLTLFLADSGVDSTQYTFGAVQDDASHPGVYTATFTGLQAASPLTVGLKVNGKDTGKRVTLTLTTGTTVVVTGNPVVGETLTANATCVGGTCGQLTWQWQIEDAEGSNHYVNILNATQQSYTPVKGDQKRKIRVDISE